ncbi:hypothetical protein K2173_025548 [Erythroxylum novogranatense]|uniref:Uncharacterized protein n=1 Tax=Erythroxylum novogranatense TaxID=1862640 RepID=A0AAV8TAG2_9ROSI|nr:hypothetical protein K2173_025548 [Erythroxylum novogranatense]
MRNRSFPYYDKLAIIWGQDRATGKNAEAPVDMLENIIREENLDEENEASNGEEDVEPRRDQPIRDNSQGVVGYGRNNGTIVASLAFRGTPNGGYDEFI